MSIDADALVANEDWIATGDSILAGKEVVARNMGEDDASLVARLVNDHRNSKLFYIDALSDPVAVHVNLLRGTIAKPSVKQILHLYPELTLRPKISEETARAGEWQPIETAPKDGTHVLARGKVPPRDNYTIEVRETHWMFYGEGSMAHAAYARGEGPSGSWYWSEPIHNWGSSWRPTHWMPLPAPPALPLTEEVAHVER